MELYPCSRKASEYFAKQLNQIRSPQEKATQAQEYAIKTFPNILIDVVNIVIKQATENAREFSDHYQAADANIQQLRPFFVLGWLLGRSPQISNLIYSYFETSSFQPLPEELFQYSSMSQTEISYAHPGFDDDLVKDILVTYFKYLSFNPKWFGSVWNWSELGRLISMHPNNDIKYLAACCLSVIIRPSRHQHMMFLQDLIPNPSELIEIQLKHEEIFRHEARPLVETKPERATEFMNSVGRSETNQYEFCSESLTKIANALLPKRDISLESNHIRKNVEKAIARFVPVPALCDALSRVAYAVSISKPCLLRGPTGSGKTSLLDYVAAHTNRVRPPEYIKVQIGDQIDSKSLIGYYVCTEIPGQFEWQAGPLTQAMAYGSWLVFEDIDSAPPELAQVIHSVIENGNLSCVSCSPIKIDNPHPDFKIFFTQRTRNFSYQESLKLGFGFIERLCDIVDMPELVESDLEEILEKRYNLGQLNKTILQLFYCAKKSCSDASLASGNRHLTLTDLFRFCDRIFRKELKANEGAYASCDLEHIFMDAIDCFVSSYPIKYACDLARNIGQILNKPVAETDAIISRRPEIYDDGRALSIGRAKISSNRNQDKQESKYESRSTLAFTRQTLRLIESISLCIENREPVLLVGETGVGKTSIVQYLSQMMNADLTVINLSQQSDSSDLLGGVRPIEMREIIKPLSDDFFHLFPLTHDVESNESFLREHENQFLKARSAKDFRTFLKVTIKLGEKNSKRSLSKDLLQRWKDLTIRARRLRRRLSNKNSSPMALTFVEGTLLQALRKGKWILLDEINLAEPDVLQCLLTILDSLKDSHVYLQSGNEKEGPIFINPKFKIFACMNPSTDIGKRDLPIGVRGRFTEFYVDEIEEAQDLRLIVESYVKTCLSPQQIECVVNFYREVRFRSKLFSDISGNSPIFSLRSLCRALAICSQNVCRNIEKSLLESLKITFLQQLNEYSCSQVLSLMQQFIFKNSDITPISNIDIPMPSDGHRYIEVEKFWVQLSSQKIITDENYILTRTVRSNIQRISRILFLGQRKLPILIQGNTSVGKTSLIKYLARISGNHFYRINNHEHTDLQEYIGKYVLRESGELQWRDGLLTKAMRKGYWVILDELNLAPSELLEAINRVLDDNREIYIPETKERFTAHNKFALFATQNPPEEYAGRKLLSRAFRNRFIELHFDELPHDELEQILHERCRMPLTYSKKIVSVMKELQVFRRESICFGGRNSFMTMRDLFRWGQRYLMFKDTVPDEQYLDWDNFLAKQGLILLEGRVRTLNEADIVKSIIEKVFKRKLDRDDVYELELSSTQMSHKEFHHIHFTPEFKRLFVQLSEALKYNEPVLLCGQTGCGKTTACQLLACLAKSNLIIFNCHANTESSDFIGNVRPSRESGVSRFPWVDGPLVQAMLSGSIFLMDEISLAGDAVLERINPVLESDKSLTLTERDGAEIRARDSFRFVATMNPGGDYGKKELSAALRNRFTEIYCHNTSNVKQIINIIGKSLSPALLSVKVAPRLLEVMKEFLTYYYKDQDIISLRDVIKWTSFLNETTSIGRINTLSIQDAILEGASLVFFDQIGTCAHKSNHPHATPSWRTEMMEKLMRLVNHKLGSQPIYQEKLNFGFQKDEDFVKFGKFSLRKGSESIGPETSFVLDAPSVKENIQMLVRAMQLDRPILLEGDPGAGKTSIVAALALLTGHKLVRINLSDQTDMSDLLGSDLPEPGANDDGEPRFCWHDGPMLKAIRDSSWILLDEMNLASQSVLEGLNACFDHRGEVYISELDKTITIDRSATKIFACQNPHNQGCARKGLPQSFVNRFTSIYVTPYTNEDLLTILTKRYDEFPEDLLEKMVKFNNIIATAYQGRGYEFNLRDLLHWCELMTRYIDEGSLAKKCLHEPDRFVQFVYIDRMRALSDKADVVETFERVFNYVPYEPPYRDIKLGEHSITIARSSLPRKTRLPPHLDDLSILKYQLPYLESLSMAIEFDKMPILVGEPGVGKRSVVKILAGLTGNQLNIIGANRDMDSIELLGSYEQQSLQREIVDLVDKAAKFTLALINDFPKCTKTDSMKRLFKHVWSTLFSASIREHRLSKTELMEFYRFQLNQLDSLIEKLQPLSVSHTKLKFDVLKRKISILKKKTLFKSESTYSSGNFEWIDSLLIKSIKEGSWLLIENANLMNPATLDRLNSLVEPNGVLYLNEKGSGPEGVEIIKAHPDFRLILTMDPNNGELSRAMRNRGVEVYVRTRFYYEDFLMLLNQAGLPIDAETSCMTYCFMQTSYDAHLEFTGEKPEDDGALLSQFGLNCSMMLSHQVRRGVSIDNVLAGLFIAFYRQRGYLSSHNDDVIKNFIKERIIQYRKTFIVDYKDNRYMWLNFRHDLRAMTGGDAFPSMLHKERKLLAEWTCPVTIGLLNISEMIDNVDIVFHCTAIKIFMELSSPSDFEYRKKCVESQYSMTSVPFFKRMLELVDTEIGGLEQECLPMIVQKLPTFSRFQTADLYIDTRNSPDTHFTLQSLDFIGTRSREDLQNRWILSLYRINLSMITDQIEKISVDGQNVTSLWSLSQKVINHQMLREELVRPQAEIVSDLYDVLNGLMRFVSNRCFPNHMVVKLMGRFFWISYFSCKLKRAFSNEELVAICNQLPMLWALTYQKVIVPLVEECKLSDVYLNNKKFSSRIKHICDFLDMTTTKPSKLEKEYYLQVLNRYAATIKRSENVSRECDRLFNTLIGRYSIKSKAIAFKDDHTDHTNLAALAASCLVWSNSIYMSAIYKVADTLLEIEAIDNESIDGHRVMKEKYEMARTTTIQKRDEYDVHEDFLSKEPSYREKCLSVNKRRCALDQFSPFWQTRFIQSRISKVFHPKTDLRKLQYNQNCTRRMLREVNGILMSPRYYSTINRFVNTIESRRAKLDHAGDQKSRAELHEDAKHNYDMYSAFLLDHLFENIVLDNQVVGWMKMRVTTSDLPSLSPIIPEYSPVISLVSSYCLDLKHLKLNACDSSSPQLESMLTYMWRSYAHIKNGYHNMVQDLKMAQSLLHLRMEASNKNKLVGNHTCTQSVDCGCLDAFARRRTTKYDENLVTIIDKAEVEDRPLFLNSLRLIYFGYYQMLECAPIFTLDPSLRSREKSEIYKAELAHLKIDLYLRNTLYYWKTGENLRLVEVTPDESKSYPFSIRTLVERRTKLERSLKRLRQEFTNRPKTDDGTLYYELRKETELAISRNTHNITTIINDLMSYLKIKKPDSRFQKLSHLNTKSRMLIKNLERSIARFKADFILYSDLTTQYLTGLCFILQGLRLLYSRLEQKVQLYDMGFKSCLVEKFARQMSRFFSFNDFGTSSMDSVHLKRLMYPTLPIVCPEECIDQARSLLLKSILLQLNHHIIITPSDIKLCIPIVRNIADKFHKAWLDRKKSIEEHRKKNEDLYQYKTPSTSLGSQSSVERQEFIDIANRFPVYDHLFLEKDESLASNDKINFKTEAEITKHNQSIDLGMCIDVCKAHYKFMKEASLSLLGDRNLSDDSQRLSNIDMNQLVKLEAELLYTVIRKSISNLDRKFDSMILECHLLQANELIKTLYQSQPDRLQVGSLESSIDILDEQTFDIYHDPYPREALKFQELLTQIDDKINTLRLEKQCKSPASITQLTTRISSFLVTDPLMKFITAAHALLHQLEEWNRNIPRDIRMSQEVDSIINLIHSWRKIELMSWHNSLHRVKRRYIDDTLCDLWFQLYEAFNDPLASVRNYLSQKTDNMDYMETTAEEPMFYIGFVSLIKDFFEAATLGDYQIRLDLVFSFAIQTRFAGLYEQSRPVSGDESSLRSNKIDYDRLTTYVYNMYRQYQGLLSPFKQVLETEEGTLSNELQTEIRVVNWQGRNLWGIKSNFRISHRKLNKVMNKYLEVLKRSITPVGLEVVHPNIDQQDNLSLGSAEQLCSVYESTMKRVSEITSQSTTDSPTQLISLKNARSTAMKMIELIQATHSSSKGRYSHVLEAIEDAVQFNADAIKSFKDQRAQDIIIHARDPRDIRDEKLKICRQIYHSKKFFLSSIFKTLHQLGVSYRRGVSNKPRLDLNILSLEPLRGMIQNQSRIVLRAAGSLIEDSLIIKCNELYRTVVTKNHSLLALERGEDVTGDQVERMKGYALDMMLDIILHKKNAALIYKHLMDIQASTLRLQQLKSDQHGETIVYNFVRFHKMVQRFNDITGRTYTALCKLDTVIGCHETFSGIQSARSRPGSGGDVTERSVLIELINDVPENHSLLSTDQQQHIQSNLADVRKELILISSELRDKLKYTIKNYIYSDDDLEKIQQLYESFTHAIDSLLPSLDRQATARPGTILGALRSIRKEAEHQLKPLISKNHLSGKAERVSLEHHTKLEKLDIRLQKLINQTKLVSQELYLEELRFTNPKPTSESEKSKAKPFNHIDSSRFRDLLRTSNVSKRISSCFITLNSENKPIDIEPMVPKLEPILTIYTQELSRYLNVILKSMHLKLILADQSISFFKGLLVGGFGLPCKVEDLEENQGESRASTNEDNTGFGEGQGDTDASNKLEFESQLDELKTNEENKTEEGASGSGEHVDAHEDGVEMTDDFDAQAEGPEDAADQEGEDQDDVESGEDNFDDLDKNLDQVDQDEGQLDKSLWGDEDDPMADDDEEDLRQADNDQSIKPEPDAKDLSAKNEELKNSKEEDESEVKNVEESEPDPKVTGEKPETSSDANDSDIDLENQNNLDVKQEVLSGDEQQEPNDEEDDYPKSDDLDSDDPLLDFIGQENSFDDDGQEDLGDEIGMDLSDLSDSSDGDDDNLQTGDLEMNLSDVTDDEDISNNESVNQKQQGVGVGDDDQDQDIHGEDLKTDGTSSTTEQEQSKPNDDLRGESAKQGNTDEETKGENSPDDDDTAPGKRTLADRSSLEQDEQTKRRRIEDPSSKDAPGESKQNEEHDRVQHIEKDTSTAIEVIDLITDSEESCPPLEDMGQSEQPTSGKPRDLRTVDSSKSDDETSLEAEMPNPETQNLQSTYNSNLGLLKYISHGPAGGDSQQSTEPKSSDPNDTIKHIDEIIKQSNKDDEHESIETDKLTSLWLECTKSNGHLVYELCQQLQIVLQPTKMSKYKGDYKSGKRLNMRKIIPYIASQYRKDKIWLRRTKPCQRTYNISLAVDNSLSMAENNCRQMTYQSLALMAKALSIIEAGSLNVVSFGEHVRCIHDFDQPYVDAIGAQWLRALNFNEAKTSYSKLLKNSCDSFARQARQTIISPEARTSVHQLLIIMSDGRSVTSEEDDIKQYLKQLKAMGVLVLFLIIDDSNQNKGKSIMDLKRFAKVSGKPVVEDYMDRFPFPFYLLLRQIEAMPSILGEALRQWFEMVTNSG